MTALPKPVRRGPKARKPIARKVRPRKVRKSTRGQLAKEADVLWSCIVRSRARCDACASERHPQAAHGFSRRYRATRWDLRNGFRLCAGCHIFYTYRPLEWDERLRSVWGQDLYDEMRARALRNERVDLQSTVGYLRAVMEAL